MRSLNFESKNNKVNNPVTCITYQIVKGGKYYKTWNDFTDNRDFAANFESEKVAQKVAANYGAEVVPVEKYNEELEFNVE